MTTYFNGLAYGLVSIFFLGSGFFALFQAALSHGFNRAMAVSVGIIMTDAVLIALIMVGFSSFIENEEVKFWLGVMGATVLVSFGISTWLRKKSLKESNVEGSSILTFWLKGVVLNGLNPIIAIFWIGAVGATGAFGYTMNAQAWFFGGFLTTILCLDVFKVLMIARLTKYFTAKALTNMNRVVGTVFIGFGLRLVAYLLEWF
ncbi:MAG: LysE family transporter [Cytophagales bacterium]|nr:LysE family transporter [Cytophagales bacterium]